MVAIDVQVSGYSQRGGAFKLVRGLFEIVSETFDCLKRRPTLRRLLQIFRFKDSLMWRARKQICSADTSVLNLEEGKENLFRGHV